MASRTPDLTKGNGTSRRRFLSTIGKSAAGLSVAAVTPQILTSNGATFFPASATDQEVKWPLPYKRLDVEYVRKLGHKGYYEAACCYGAFGAIVWALREKVGYPFTMIPVEMMRYGEGGGAGWGTLCGALNGAAAAINLVSGPRDYGKLINELMQWYQTFKFPSDESNQIGQENGFLVQKYDKALTQSAANSPLCHQSVTNWCLAAGFRVGSPEHIERCGRLTGDVAAKAASLLNDNYVYSFTVQNPLPASVNACRSCHDAPASFAQGGFARGGKMDCEPCHTDNPH